jgi:hypothetical protein
MLPETSNSLFLSQRSIGMTTIRVAKLIKASVREQNKGARFRNVLHFQYAKKMLRENAQSFWGLLGSRPAVGELKAILD